MRKNPNDVIEHLAPEDALAILGVLARNDKALAGRIAEIAMARWRSEDAEHVSDGVFHALDALREEEMLDRAGQTSHGYVDPHEAAGMMLDEALQPFLERLDRYRKLGLSDESLQLLQGILAGLHRFEQEAHGDFHAWVAPHMAIEAQELLDAWRACAPERTQTAKMRRFIEMHLPNWQTWLQA